jgi:hypothetical protein
MSMATGDASSNIKEMSAPLIIQPYAHPALITLSQPRYANGASRYSAQLQGHLLSLPAGMTSRRSAGPHHAGTPGGRAAGGTPGDQPPLLPRLALACLHLMVWSSSAGPGAGLPLARMARSRRCACRHT